MGPYIYVLAPMYAAAARVMNFIYESIHPYSALALLLTF